MCHCPRAWQQAPLSSAERDQPSKQCVHSTAQHSDYNHGQLSQLCAAAGGCLVVAWVLYWMHEVSASTAGRGWGCGMLSHVFAPWQTCQAWPCPQLVAATPRPLSLVSNNHDPTTLMNVQQTRQGRRQKHAADGVPKAHKALHKAVH